MLAIGQQEHVQKLIANGVGKETKNGVKYLVMNN